MFALEFDISDDIKEEVLIDEVVSPFLKEIQLDLRLPAGYHLLKKAEPNIILFTDDQQIGGKYLIESLTESIFLEKPIKATELYLYLSLYYCKSDDSEGLCIIKKILFEIPVDIESKEKILVLEHVVSDAENFIAN